VSPPEESNEAAGALRVFIADDEELARDRLRTLLADVAPEIPTAIVGDAANGIEVIERLPGTGARVLLLDIQMPGMAGLEVARHLAQLPDAPAVIFITAHERHAVEAFELNALDYLLKPVRAPRLAAALKKAAGAAPASSQSLGRVSGRAREYFSVAERNRISLVPVRDVVYFKAELKYVTLRTRAGEHLIEEPLVQLENEFADRFVRIHRNCLVARAAIRGFERAGREDDEPHWEVMLEGIEERLPVSRRQWQAVRELVAENRRG
jgi:two-component system response regulator AlgR